jgi:2-polyprenyl-6-methoxyphenol hydroxylase-like FAD-dependent oxidoreductase
MASLNRPVELAPFTQKPCTVAIVGGGISGMATALALSRAGHVITLFERDDIALAANPHDAFEVDRRGAPQVRHSHAFLARLRNLLRDEYPDILEALYAAGATDLRFGDGIPATITDYQPEAGDEDLTMLACRRTTFEWVIRKTVVEEGRVTVHSGTEVTGLITSGTSPEGQPIVSGVQLGECGTMSFDWTIVATGRRGALPAWLEALGTAAPNEIVDDSGIVYFSRFYRLNEGMQIPPRTGPIGGDLGYLKYGVFAGDNGTFSLTLACATDDAVTRKALDDEGRFDEVGRALTFTKDYLDGRATAITPVHKIAGLISRWRDYVADGKPLALGVLPVGDAHLATNPLYGRGCTTGFVNAHLLAQVFAHHDAADLQTIALEHDAAITAELKPWVMQTMQTDADARRVATAILNGEDPDADQTDPRTFMRSVFRDGLRPAMRTDATVLRSFFRNFNLLTPPDALAKDPDFGARVLQAYQERDTRPPEPYLGPDRSSLLELIGAGSTE